MESGPVATAIHTKLHAAFSPEHLSVKNESSAHNVPKGSETHFKVVVVSDAFVSVQLVERHRAVNDALAAELAGPVHALSIVAKTPEQWAKRPSVPDSPACLGGANR
jgi:BolA protein